MVLAVYVSSACLPPSVRTALLVAWGVFGLALLITAYVWARQSAKRAVMVAALVVALCIASLAHAQSPRVKPRAEKSDQCALIYCPMVTRGEMSWYAALLFGCWC